MRSQGAAGGGAVGEGGVLVADLAKDGFASAILKPGDIITKMYIPDVFSANSLSASGYFGEEFSIEKVDGTQQAICAAFDRHGQISAYKTSMPTDADQQDAVKSEIQLSSARLSLYRYCPFDAFSRRGMGR